MQNDTKKSIFNPGHEISVLTIGPQPIYKGISIPGRLFTNDEEERKLCFETRIRFSLSKFKKFI